MMNDEMTALASKKNSKKENNNFNLKAVFCFLK